MGRQRALGLSALHQTTPPPAWHDVLGETCLARDLEDTPRPLRAPMMLSAEAGGRGTLTAAMRTTRSIGGDSGASPSPSPSATGAPSPSSALSVGGRKQSVGSGGG